MDCYRNLASIFGLRKTAFNILVVFGWVLCRGLVWANEPIININIVSPREQVFVTDQLFDSNLPNAPRAYLGSKWNNVVVSDLGGDPQQVLANNLFASNGRRTTASITFTYRSVWSGSEAPDVLRNYVFVRADAGAAEHQFVVEGLIPESKWDVFVLSQGDNDGQGIAMTLGGQSGSATGDAWRDSSFLEDRNYIKFTGVVADERGRIEGIWTNNERSVFGALNGVQLVPLDAAQLPLQFVGLEEWQRGGGDSDFTLVSGTDHRASLSWTADSGRTDASAVSYFEKPVELVDGESITFSFTVQAIVSVSPEDLAIRFGLLNDVGADETKGAFIASVDWGESSPTAFKASVNADGSEFTIGTDVFEAIGLPPSFTDTLESGHSVDFSYTITREANQRYGLRIVWGSGDSAQVIEGSGHVPSFDAKTLNGVFVSTDTVMPAGATFQVVGAKVERSFMLNSALLVEGEVNRPGLSYAVAVEAIPVSAPLVLPVLDAAMGKFPTAFLSGIDVVNTTASGRGFPEGAETLWAAYAYFHPSSPAQGNVAYRDRLLLLLDARFSANWNNAVDYGMDGAFHALYAYALLKHYEPERVAAFDWNWKQGIESYVAKVFLANPNLYDRHILGSLWLNGDIRFALGVYFAGIALQKPAWVNKAQAVLDNVMPEAVMPDGGTHYLGYNTEVPTYHSDSIQFMLWWHVLTGSESMHRAVARTLNWVPLTAEPSGTMEQSSSIAYKHRYNGINGDRGALWKAYLFGDRYNYYFGRSAENISDRYSALMTMILYRPDLEIEEPPSDYILFDRSLLGPRGRFGNWAFLGIGRNPQIPEPEHRDQGLEAPMIGKSTFVGALLTTGAPTTGEPPDGRSLLAALDGVNVGVKHTEGEEVDYERGTKSWFLAQDEETATITRRTFGTLSTSYNLSNRRSAPATINWKNWSRPWRGSQLWIMTPERVIGLLGIESLVDQQAYSVNLRALLFGGRAGIVGRYHDLVETSHLSYEFSELRFKIHHDDFGGDVAIDRISVDNRSDGFGVRIKLQDTLQGDEEVRRDYLQGESKWAVVEATKAGVGYATSVRSLPGLPNGLIGFEMKEPERKLLIVHNPTEMGRKMTTSLSTDYDTVSAHLSWSETVETLPLQGSGFIVKDFEIPPHGHFVLVNSDRGTDHQGGFMVYEDLFTEGGAVVPDMSWRVFTGEDLVLPRGVAKTLLHGQINAEGTPPQYQFVWSVESGKTGVKFSSPSSSSTEVHFPGEGMYQLRLSASDGATVRSDDIYVTVRADDNAAWAVLFPSADATLDRGGQVTDTVAMPLVNNPRTGSRIYLQFDVATLDADWAKTELAVHVTGDTGTGTISLYAGSQSSWSEDTLSLSNAPQSTGNLLDWVTGTAVNPFEPGQALIFDVSGIVSGPGNYQFILELDADSNDLKIASRESEAPPTLQFRIEGDGQFINLSTRGQVGSGDRVLIGGFAISGEQPAQVLVRAAGPALTGFGIEEVLVDPVLTLFAADGRKLNVNSTWGDAPNSEALAEAAEAVGAFSFASGSTDAAMLLVLEPGIYTIQVKGRNDSVGVALVEVYHIN